MALPPAGSSQAEQALSCQKGSGTRKISCESLFFYKIKTTYIMEPWATTFWNRNKIILKSFLIGMLGLILLIPTVFIQNLVSERQQRQREAVDEISSKWAGSQTITGPVIGIPYMESVATTDQNNTNTRQEKKWAYFLPNKLDIHARIIPEKRYRGIYQVIVYATELQIKGSYDSLHIAELNIGPDQLLWSEAAVFFDISDVQGLKEEMALHISGADLALVPSKYSTEQFRNSLSASFPVRRRRRMGRWSFLRRCS